MGKKRMVSKKGAVLVDDSEDEFVHTNILDDKAARDCDLEAVDIASILENFGFDPSVDIHIPEGGVRADAHRKGWICMYEYPFLLGLRFPFPDLIQSFLKLNSLSMGQIMPNTWRILMSVVALNENEGMYLNLQDLAHAYEVKPYGSGRVILKQREGIDSFITFTTGKNDRGWMSRYLFVRIDSLPGDPDYLFDTWNVDKVFKQPELSSDIEAVIHEVLELPLERRSYPQLLGDKFRATLDSVRPKEELQEQTMSSEVVKGKTQVSISELAERKRKRKLTSSVSTIPTPSVVVSRPDSFVPPKAPKKSSIVDDSKVSRPGTAVPLPVVRPRVDPCPTGAKSTTVTFPAGFGVESSVPMGPVIEKLLLPESVAHLRGKSLLSLTDEVAINDFKMLQTSLFVRGEVTKLYVELEKAQGEVAAAKQELKKVEDSSVARLKALQDDLDKSQELEKVARGDAVAALDQLGQVERTSAENISVLKEKNSRLKSMMVDAAAYFGWEAKVQCLEAYARGEHSSWDAAAERAKFVQCYAEAPEFVFSDDEEGDEESDGQAAADVVPVPEKIPVGSSVIEEEQGELSDNDKV